MRRKDFQRFRSDFSLLHELRRKRADAVDRNENRAFDRCFDCDGKVEKNITDFVGEYFRCADLADIFRLCRVSIYQSEIGEYSAK